MKRPSKIVFKVEKPPSSIHFTESIGARGVSIYIKALSDAINCEGAIQLTFGDAYMRHQIRKAAKTLKLRLLYAVEGETVWIKPVSVEGDTKRLMLLLREPRTMNELMAAKLELHLSNTLSVFARDGAAHEVKGKWVLTEKGFDLL